MKPQRRISEGVVDFHESDVPDGQKEVNAPMHAPPVTAFEFISPCVSSSPASMSVRHVSPAVHARHSDASPSAGIDGQKANLAKDFPRATRYHSATHTPPR